MINNMRVSKFLTLVCMFFLLTESCSRSHESVSGETFNIDLKADNPVVTVDSVSEIALVTDSVSPIGMISKFLGHGNDCFIMDIPTQTVWKFDNDGQLIGKLSRIGNGPGEYGRLYDIDLDSDGNLYLLDMQKKKILRYSVDSMEFIAETKLPGNAVAFCGADSTTFYLNNPGGKKGITAKLGIFKSGEKDINPLVESAIKDEYRAFGANSTHIWRSGNDLLYYDRFTPDIYELTQDSIISYATINGGEFPSAEDVQALIDASKNHDYAPFMEESKMVKDLLYAYKTVDGIALGLSTVPQTHVYKSFEDGKTYTIRTDGNAHFNGAVKGAIGVWNDRLVTFKPSENDGNPSLVLYKVGKQ